MERSRIVYHVCKSWLHSLVDCFNLCQNLEFFATLLIWSTKSSFYRIILLRQNLEFFAALLIKRWSKAESFTIFVSLLHALLDCFNLRKIWTFLPHFWFITMGTYVASNSGLFLPHFWFITIGTYIASNSGLFCLTFDSQL